MKNDRSKGILIATGIFPPDIGGPASYAATLATRLHALGIPVCVVSYSRQFNTRSSDSRYPFPVIRVWGGWPIWIKHLIFGVKLLIYVPRYHTVYALNVWSAGFPARLAARLFKRKFIIKIVGDYAWEVAVGKGKTDLLINDFQKSTKTGWIGTLARLEALICKGAHLVIVPSEYLAGIVHGWGIPRERIHVVYNGVDFQPSTLTKEEARKQLGIFGHVIISWGRLVTWKGFRMLIKIMPKILETNQAFRLVIVGDGPDRKPLEAMVRNLGLERKVFLAGKKTPAELAVYLAAADLFVLNTGYEGFSHQILEALTAGVPIITTNVGGNVEIITQGENGLMLKYNDEFNLTEAILSLWKSPEIRDEFIRNGKETVKRFSVEKMFDETMSSLTS